MGSGGVQRIPGKVLSGSSGRDDETRSDGTHGRLFIETKLRANSATRRLWEQTRALARPEGKVPVLALFSKNKPGALLVIRQDDLAAVAACLAVPPDDQPGATLWTKTTFEPTWPTRLSACSRAACPLGWLA